MRRPLPLLRAMMKAVAMGMAYIQWADMMYTSLRPKPRPTCSTMSRAKYDITSHRKRERRPHHTPTMKSSTTSASTM